MAQSQLWAVLGIAPTAILGAALLVALTVAAGTRYRLGPDADWVEIVRAVCLPVLDAVIETAIGGVGSAYQIGDRELVGVVDASPEELEEMLWDAGCRRNVLSASKSLPDGRRQVGAWVQRDTDVVGAQMQVDILLFESERGTAVYAHHEFSSSLRWLLKDRSVLHKHYRGATYDPAAGEQILQRSILPDVTFE